MKILLTGATGFVGSHVASDLVGRGHEVHALVRKNSRHDFLKEKGIRLIFGDLSKLAVEKIDIPPVDVVVHIAGLIKAKKVDDFYRVNTEGTRHLLQQISGESIRHFIFVSSIAARGPNKSLDDEEGMGPVCHYGKSKLLAEKIVLEYQNRFPVTLVRPPIVYGPGDRETLILFKFFKRGFFPLMGGQKGVNSFVFVEDLSRILVELAEKPHLDCGPFYPSDGRQGHNWADLLQFAEELFQRKIRKIYIPYAMGQWTALLSEYAGLVFGFVPLLNRDKFAEMRHPFWFCSNEKLHQAYSLPNPVDFREGFLKTKRWYEEQGWL